MTPQRKGDIPVAQYPPPKPSATGMSPLRLRQRGSVLVIVLWIAFGLVMLALYFANSMTLELRGAQNRVASVEAEHAINGASRYVNYVLTYYGTNGILPNLTQDLPGFHNAGARIGECDYWLLGRSDQQLRPERATFGLVDEAARLNLNTATAEMLQLLPRMTVELAAAIIDWRDADSTPLENGAEDEVYNRLTPPRLTKNAPFETTEELRLVSGFTLEILYGEDTNLNGVLDPNENDGEDSPPFDNRDSRLDPGLLEYVTVYSQQPNTRADGSARVNITTAQGRRELTNTWSEVLSESRAREIITAVGNGNLTSVLQFYARSGLTADEFALVHTDLTSSNAPPVGLVNVNTASAAVLACIPGIGVELAPTLVAFRASNPTRLTSLAWVTEILDATAIQTAGRYLTDQAYQPVADIAALGANGRGFRRLRIVFDTSETTPKILFRRDLTSLGWPLSAEVREELQLAKETRP